MGPKEFARVATWPPPRPHVVHGAVGCVHKEREQGERKEPRGAQVAERATETPRGHALLFERHVIVGTTWNNYNSRPFRHCTNLQNNLISYNLII